MVKWVDMVCVVFGMAGALKFEKFFACELASHFGNGVCDFQKR
jgi:hypothetical protein